MQKMWVQSLDWESLVAETVKNPPAIWETWVQSLGWEDRLEEGVAAHSSILAWRIPMHGGAWWATHHGVAKSQTQLSTAPGYVFGKAESPNLKRYAHPTWRQPKWPLTDEWIKEMRCTGLVLIR